MREGDFKGIEKKKKTTTTIRLSEAEADFCLKEGNGNKSNYIRFLIQREMQNEEPPGLDEKIETIVRRILDEMRITPQKLQDNESLTSAEVTISADVKEKSLKGLKGFL